MRTLVISDSHGNIVRLNHVLGFAKQYSVGAIIHCGDWGSVTSSLNSMKNIPIYGVLGNADYSLELIKNLKKAQVIFEPDFLTLDLGGRRIAVCHYPTKLFEAIQSQQYDAVFHGHTHKKRNEVVGRTQIINPGALERTLSPSFALYDTETNQAKIVDVLL